MEGGGMNKTAQKKYKIPSRFGLIIRKWPYVT